MVLLYFADNGKNQKLLDTSTVLYLCTSKCVYQDLKNGPTTFFTLGWIKTSHFSIIMNDFFAQKYIKLDVVNVTRIGGHFGTKPDFCNLVEHRYLFLLVSND